LGITEARLYPAIAVPPDGEQRSQLLILLDRVNETWVEGVLRNSLFNEALISLGKHPIGEAVEPPWTTLSRSWMGWMKSPLLCSPTAWRRLTILLIAPSFLGSSFAAGLWSTNGSPNA
jgi:hypothetical protein